MARLPNQPVARRNEVRTETRSTGAVHTPTGETENVPALPGVNAPVGNEAVADLREERTPPNTGPGVVTPSSAPTPTSAEELPNRPGEPASGERVRTPGEAPIVRRARGQREQPVAVSKQADGYRHTPEAWWCPKCDNSQTYSFETCANCGAKRPKDLDDPQNR